jgi:hypothetical protein
VDYLSDDYSRAYSRELREMDIWPKCTPNL